MIRAPRSIDGADVIEVADVSRSTPTGNTRHVADGAEIGAVAGLLVARYPDDHGVYLIYCDDAWRIITDTFHETLDDAITQAEFEFQPVKFEDAAAGSSVARRSTPHDARL